MRLSLLPGRSPSLKSALTLNWSTVADSVAYENIHYHLRLLDTYLLDQWAPSSPQDETQSQEPNEESLEKARDTWFVDDLISLGVCLEIIGQNDDLESGKETIFRP